MRRGEGAEGGGGEGRELGGLESVFEWSQFGQLLGQSSNTGVQRAGGSGEGLGGGLKMRVKRVLEGGGGGAGLFHDVVDVL